MNDKSVLGYVQVLLSVTVSNNSLDGLLSFLVVLPFVAYI